MRLLAPCLARGEALTSLVVGVIFKGVLLPCSCQNESWKYLFYIIFLYFFVAGTSRSAIYLPFLSSSPPLSLSLSPSCPVSFSLFFVGLGVIGELDSYFFSHHALILSHAAWLTGSWSARTELLITGSPPPPPPSASATHTHTHTHTHTQSTISVWLVQV